MTLQEIKTHYERHRYDADMMIQASKQIEDLVSEIERLKAEIETLKTQIEANKNG